MSWLSDIRSYLETFAAYGRLEPFSCHHWIISLHSVASFRQTECRSCLFTCQLYVGKPEENMQKGKWEVKRQHCVLLLWSWNTRSVAQSPDTHLLGPAHLFFKELQPGKCPFSWLCNSCGQAEQVCTFLDMGFLCAYPWAAGTMQLGCTDPVLFLKIFFQCGSADLAGVI